MRFWCGGFRKERAAFLGLWELGDAWCVVRVWKSLRTMSQPAAKKNHSSKGCHQLVTFGR